MRGKRVEWNTPIFLEFSVKKPIACQRQKWNLQKSACDDGVKNELRLVLAKIGANLSFPGLKMLLNGL